MKFYRGSGKKKFLPYDINFCHFPQKLFILAISAAWRVNDEWKKDAE